MAGVGAVRLLVVDDHPLFRRGLAVALSADPELLLVGEAGNAEEALEIIGREAIDVAFVDVLMPDVSGISLALELYERQPACRVIGLSVIDEPGLIADMLRAHAAGFALKTQTIDEIIEAIRQVRRGVRYLPHGVSSDAVDAELRGHHSLQRLTKREREIFELLIRGHSNDDVAMRLFIARRTVETHRHRIMHKLSAHSITQMQRVAARYGGLVS